MRQIENESGRSMVEMLAVIGIVSIMTVGAISGINYAMQTFRAGTVYDLIETAARGTGDLYSWKRAFDTDPNDFKNMVCGNDIFDTPCVADQNAATISAGWGQIKLIPADAACFNIELTNVPQRGCQLLQNMAWRYAQPGTCQGAAALNCSSANPQTLRFYVE